MRSRTKHTDMTDCFAKKVLEDGSDASDEETDIEDEDTCSAPQLAADFVVQFKPHDESTISLKKDYVLSLCADASFSHIAAGLSNTAVQLYDVDTGGALTSVDSGRVELQVNSAKTIESEEVTICGVRFLDETPNVLCVGTTNGLVRLFDLRTTGEQARFEYKADTESEIPPAPQTISCFDCNANGRILCTGTEQYYHNVYLLFYDLRERKQLGAYYESHQDDVTSVRFHARNPDLLCSGGTDGLINIYDIREKEEDDALLNTINTESSVHRLNWHRDVYEKDVISCITHTNDFMSYECEEGDEIAAFNRSDITTGIRRKNAGNFNLINTHNMDDNSVFLLAGTNFNRGEVLRSVTVQNKQTIKPWANFIGNKQIVRDSLYDAKRNLLVTGGEAGIITVWSQDISTKTKSSKLKSKTKSKIHKKNPY